MKNHYVLTLTALAAAVAVPAWANVAHTTIGTAKNHENKTVTVSGVISDVDANDEFTITDRTGSIEAHLTTARTDLNEGDYVTVTGRIDPTLINELADARVNVLKNSYNDWQTSYRGVYGRDYDLNAFDADFKADNN